MLRRSMLLSGVAVLPLALVVRCTGTQGAVTLDQAKAYMTDAAGAVLAAAQAYLASVPPPNAATAFVITGLMDKLEAIQATLEGVTAAANWRAGAIEGLAVLQQLSPLVAPYLGPAGPVLPIAIAVISAFIHSLPAPPDAPPTPPAALHRKAMEYHPHH